MDSMGSEVQGRTRLTRKGERTWARTVAVTLLATLQGGLLLALVQRDIRPLETAVGMLLELAGGGQIRAEN